MSLPMTLTPQGRQRGVALVVVLMVLVVVALLGTTAMRSALFQSKVSVNTQIAQLSFQGAESGLAAVVEQATADFAGGRSMTSQQHIFYKALYVAPQRICVLEDGTIKVESGSSVASRDADSGEITYEPCDAMADNPAVVTAVVAQPPPGQSSGGLRAGFSQQSNFQTYNAYVRAHAEVGSAPAEVHAQYFGVLGPSAGRTFN